MKTTQIKWFILFLLALPLYGHCTDNSHKVSHQVQASIDKLKQWDKQLISHYLQFRISENQHLIDFVNESHVNDVKTEHDEGYNQYLSSLLKDQATLAELSKNLLKYSQAQNLDIDSVLVHRPLLRSSVKRDINKVLDGASGKRILNKMLYFSLQDKYAVQSFEGYEL
jgi:hypothetical protein